MLDTVENTPDRIGLNSLRDYYLDQWNGKVVTGIEEANKFLSITAKNLTERNLIKRLKTGEFYVTFVKDLQTGDTIQADFEHLKEISFRIIPVEIGLGLVYFYVNRKKGRIDSKFITAELEGLNKLLRVEDFHRDYTRAWMECRITDRLICIKEINMILSDDNLREAFLNYSPHFNRNDYENWREEFNISLKIRKGHRYLISRVIKSIVSLSKRKANKNKREG